MSRSIGRRWVAVPAVAAVLVAVCFAGTARADVTVERTMKTAGFAGIGAGDSTVVEKLSGLRKRDVTSMKMTGFLGKIAGEMGGDEITDIGKDVVWRLDHKQKTYTESRITPPPQEREGKPEREEKKEKPKVRVVRNEVSVKGPGEKKRIGEFDCARYTIVWELEVEDLETKERSESRMTSDLWSTPETAATRALQDEERAFTQAWLKKIGWDMTDRETQRMGLAMVGALVGGDEESFKKGAKEIAEKMEKIKGYPIGTGVKWEVKGGAGAAASKRDEGGGEPVPDIAKGIGGLMAAFGKKGGKGGGEAAGAGSSGDAGGWKTVFDTYTEVRKISTASIADGEFAPPAGYKKVQ